MELERKDWMKVIMVFRAVRDILKNYEKCPQYPENVTIRPRYLNALRDAMRAWDNPKETPTGNASDG